MSKLKPILFSTPMVQAILGGKKTMTRRIIKKQPGFKVSEIIPPNQDVFNNKNKWVKSDYYQFRDYSLQCPVVSEVKCPYGKIGDVLWVREKTRTVYNDAFDLITEYATDNCEPIYLADGDGTQIINKYGSEKMVPWKPSIFMPKKACRLFLKIKNIRVERLQDINEDDAMAEGINLVEYNCFENYLVDTDWKFRGVNQKNYHMYEDPIGSVASLWAKINGPESWDLNPYVWVIEFEKTVILQSIK